MNLNSQDNRDLIDQAQALQHSGEIDQIIEEMQKMHVGETKWFQAEFKAIPKDTGNALNMKW
jgi:hypothetical protein